MSTLGSNLVQAAETASAIRETFKLTPKDHYPSAAVILGSGFGPLLASLENAVFHPFNKFPHLSQPGVAGHKGQIGLVSLGDKKVIVINGRFHLYEGYTPAQQVFFVKVIHSLGIPNLVLTNAAGALEPQFCPGDLMLIEDHINLPGMIGKNPLVELGEDAVEGKSKFLDSQRIYNPEFLELIKPYREANKDHLHCGTYVCVHGPNYESPAEALFLKTIGAHACGMSTTNEAIMAHYYGIKVLAFSAITNAIPTSLGAENITNHEEVVEMGKQIAPRALALLTHFMISVI